jgi:hypothetical protein
VASHASSFMTKSQCMSVLGMEGTRVGIDIGVDSWFALLSLLLLALLLLMFVSSSWIPMEERRDCISVCRVRRKG